MPKKGIKSSQKSHNPLNIPSINVDLSNSQNSSPEISEQLSPTVPKASSILNSVNDFPNSHLPVIEESDSKDASPTINPSQPGSATQAVAGLDSQDLISVEVQHNIDAFAEQLASIDSSASPIHNNLHAEQNIHRSSPVDGQMIWDALAQQDISIPSPENTKHETAGIQSPSHFSPIPHLVNIETMLEELIANSTNESSSAGLDVPQDLSRTDEQLNNDVSSKNLNLSVELDSTGSSNYSITPPQSPSEAAQSSPNRASQTILSQIPLFSSDLEDTSKTNKPLSPTNPSLSGNEVVWPGIVTNLIRLTYKYQTYLDEQLNITTGDKHAKLKSKFDVIVLLLGDLNKSEDSDEKKVSNFAKRLSSQKEMISAHSSPSWERYLQAACLVALSAIAIVVPAIVIDLNAGLVLLGLCVAILAAVAAYHKVETNSWNFFSARGNTYCEQAELNLKINP